MINIIIGIAIGVALTVVGAIVYSAYIATRAK